MTLAMGRSFAGMADAGSVSAVEDRFDLERFVAAQEGVYDQALAELRAGRKRSHWMWFVFPQVAGLGRSPTAQRYAISGIEEAQAYLAHPMLGPRLLECCQALLGLPDPDPSAVLGGTDALKLRSSVTLFAHARPEEPLFRSVLERWYGGRADDATERILGLAG
jgi:uncharacterized protein (DUF1810 family)